MVVNCNIANIFLFKIDTLLFSESIQFGTKMFRTKYDDKIKLREILELLKLSLGQHLDSRKILKVFIIYNNIDRKD